MTTSEEAGPPEPEPDLPPLEPTRALLFAQALDACISAERQEPGSAEPLIAAEPVWTRAELEKLIGLAGSLEAVATNAIMSEEFRVAARARLMRRIGADPAARPAAASTVAPGIRLSAVPVMLGVEPRPRRSRSAWLRRACAGLFTPLLGLAVTLTPPAAIDNPD